MKVCSFFGHRKIAETEELVSRVRNEIENLILYHNVRVFLFGNFRAELSFCRPILSLLTLLFADSVW